MIEIADDKCTGCEICGIICPKNAISFKIMDGFRYPTIDKEKCINCNLCIKVCPSMNNEKNINKTIVVYAAWTKDKDKRIQSTSGGICYELSKEVINRGGYVAGVAWDDDYRNAHYEIIHSLDEIPRISQTKYFQPRMAGIYKKIEYLLLRGELVLYIGTACTNNALRNYLGKDFDNLICCDFICRGYTSQAYHEKRIIDLEAKYFSPIRHVQYKNKEKGWKNFGTKFWFENGKTFYINRHEDPYELMFKKDDFNTRPSCFNCKYRNLPRLSDITVGDFWGLQGLSLEEERQGVSAVIVSTEKGMKIFDSIKSKLEWSEHSVSEITRGNFALLNQLNKKNGASQFFYDLERLSISKVDYKYAIRGTGKMIKVLKFFKNVLKCNPADFIYFNFISSSVRRKKHRYIFPVWGSKIDLEKKSQLIINDNLFLNVPKHKKSKEEMYLKISRNGSLEINGICKFGAMNTIEINENAKLVIGRLTSNYGTTIICGNNITIGNDVGIGRNVTIYDNNFHSTNMNSNKKNKPLVIEDHVWLCTGVTIVKGIRIEYGAVCSINSTITRNIKSKNMVAGNPAKVVMTNIEW